MNEGRNPWYDAEIAYRSTRIREGVGHTARRGSRAGLRRPAIRFGGSRRAR